MADWADAAEHGVIGESLGALGRWRWRVRFL